VCARESAEKYDGEEWFKRLSIGEKLPKGRAKAKKKKGGEAEELTPLPEQTPLLQRLRRGVAHVRDHTKDRRLLADLP